MRQPVALEHASRLLNHGPVVLVSAAHQGRANVMTAAWCMALDFRPPRFAVVLAQETFTRELVDASGALVLQVPPCRMLEIVDGVGTTTGREVDKWSRFGLTRTEGTAGPAPLVGGCLAWLECRVLPEPGIATSYDLFVVEAVAAWADDEAFANGRWRMPLPPELRSLHHLSGGSYLVDGEVVSVAR